MWIVRGTVLLALLVLIGNGVLAQTGNEDTLFAVAFAHSSYSMEVEGEIGISSKVTTSVTITGESISDTFTVNANSTYIYDVSSSYRVDSGVESKGFIVDADEPVTVQVFSATYAGVRIPDAILARPLSTDFWITSFMGHPECNRKPLSFYMVIASEDNTDVSIDGVYKQTLNKHQVYTVDAYTEVGPTASGTDYSGTHVTSDKPVSVYGGHGCAVVNVQPAWMNQYFMESMPIPSELGQKFITIPIHFGNQNAGYKFAITATQDNTSVTIPALGITENNILDAGDTQYHDFTVTSDVSFAVECDKDCQVMQYSNEVRVSGGPNDIESGGFMTTLTSMDHLSDNLMFTLPTIMNSYLQTYARVSIVSDSSSPANMFLNDVNLDYLDWQPVNGESGMSFASVELDSSKNWYLYTWDPAEQFTATLYTCDVAGSAIMMGAPAGYGVTGVATTTTTTTEATTTQEQVSTEATESTTPTTPSPETREPPRYEIKLHGNFTSLNGDNFTAGCNDLHNNNLRDKAQQMIPYFNAWIGESMCTHISNGAITIISTSTAFQAELEEGQTEVAWTAKNTNPLMLEDVYNCADEIIVYMSDFSHWPSLPIFPVIDGCAQPVFDPSYFFDGTTGRDWRCTGLSAAENSYEYRLNDAIMSNVTKDPPLYEVSYWDNFTTRNDEVMTSQCLDAYRSSWSEQVFQMASDLGDAMDAGTVCTFTHNRLTMANQSSAQITTAPGEMGGAIQSEFLLFPINDTVTFNEVYACADELYSHVKEHSLWPNTPVIPNEIGCATMDFTPPTPPEFYENGQQWLCPSFIITAHEAWSSHSSMIMELISWMKNLIFS